MDRTVHRTVIDRNTVPNLRKPYKIRWCTVITVPYRITVNRTIHRRVTTLAVINALSGGNDLLPRQKFPGSVEMRLKRLKYC